MGKIFNFWPLRLRNTLFKLKRFGIFLEYKKPRKPRIYLIK